MPFPARLLAISMFPATAVVSSSVVASLLSSRNLGPCDFILGCGAVVRIAILIGIYLGLGCSAGCAIAAAVMHRTVRQLSRSVLARLVLLLAGGLGLLSPAVLPWPLQDVPLFVTWILASTVAATLVLFAARYVRA